MIVILDYGVGNLFSLKNALDYLNIDSIISNDPQAIRAADGLILPGVGAFQDAMRSLIATDLIPLITQEVTSGKPLLGICLGMQLLYERSFEFGECAGLGFFQGDIIDMRTTIRSDLKIPHMGWNALTLSQKHPLLETISTGDQVYFVHSYYVKDMNQEVIAYSDYEINIPAIVAQNNIYGMQFHPEKSGPIGLALLRNFAKVVNP